MIEDVVKLYPRQLCEKIKETINRRKICSAASSVESKTGTIFMKILLEILERWEEFKTELFKDNSKNRVEIDREENSTIYIR